MKDDAATPKDTSSKATEKNLKHFPTINGWPHPFILKTVIEQYRRLDSVLSELTQLIAEKFPDGMPAQFAWAHLYTYPYIQLMMAKALENKQLAEKLISFTAKHDPNLAVARATDLANVNSMVDDEFVPPSNKEYAIRMIAEGYGFARVMARSMQCVAVHNKEMYELMHEAKNNNNESLFLAIKVDNAISTLPFVQARFNEAMAMDKKDFTEPYKRALQYDFSARAKEVTALDELKILCHTLKQFPGIDAFSTTEIMTYLREGVGYTGYFGDDDNLRRHINNYRY